MKHPNKKSGKIIKFNPLNWPLSLYEYGNAQVKRLAIFSPKYRYSLRMARYWFAASEIDLELNRLGKYATIVDVGCERGITKAFCPERDNVHWTGLDLNISRPELERACYNKIHQCSFDDNLPIENEYADIVVCLHVLEHLPRPEFTLGEITRILKPNGIIIGATPVVPEILTRNQEKDYNRKIQSVNGKQNGHINSYTPRRLRKLVESHNCVCELMCGGHLLRWSNNPLEGSAGWIRLNQLWGCFLPALSGEIFIVARKQRSY